jgi:RNA polymerase sigma-70 factor (ECF subfamily)
MREDDRALVEAVRAGQVERFAALVDRHAAAVFRVVRAVVRQAADADDLAQEVFLASFRALPKLRDPSRFRAHLLTIAARKAADHLRRKSRRTDPLPLTVEPSARPPHAEHAADTVDGVVEDLPAATRLLLALRHHEGLSCVQIARVLDLPEGTVYSRLSRAHAAIRRALEVTDR